MPIFSSPDLFEEHKQYIPLLKKALLGVKPDLQKKFLYFKQYPFGAKKLPLVLVDFDLNCSTALAKAGYKPTDEGLVSLTQQGELNFEGKKGNLKRIRLKKYFATMGSGIKPVFVPTGETDDESESDTTTVPAAPPRAPAPAIDENEAKRRQLLARIQELQAKPFPPKIEALKSQVLEKAKSLGQVNKFPEATLLLDQLAAKAGSSDTSPATAKLPANDPFAQSWAAAKQAWEAANKDSSAQIEKLQKVLRESGDEDLAEIAEFGLNGVTGNFKVRLMAAIVAMDSANAETRAGIAKRAASIVSGFRSHIDTHPQVKACDENPLGVPVNIRSSIGGALTELSKVLATA